MLMGQRVPCLIEWVLGPTLRGTALPTFMREKPLARHCIAPVTKLMGTVWDASLHEGEGDDVTDGGAVGEQHDQAVHPNTQAAGGGHAVLQSSDEVIVDSHL